MRLDVETDIRDVKITLKTDDLLSKSVDMLKKEIAMAFVAYNLVVQVRRLAAQAQGKATPTQLQRSVEPGEDHPATTRGGDE